MLAWILAFVMIVVGALGQGLAEAPGLNSPPTLPEVAEEEAQATSALEEAGRPETLPANDRATGGFQEQGQPANTPPVETSGAPVVVDLSNVPASEKASVPETVGAAESASLPDQAGGTPAGPPSEVPVAETSAETGKCAANARGREAANC